jgi:uncharacterized membrane protein
MFLDSPLALSFIYIFFIHNIFGWGWMHDKFFFIFAVCIGLIYLFLDGLAVFKKNKAFTVIKIIIILLFLGISVFGVTINLIFLRSRITDVSYISDSALQTEIAGRFILLGENPYVKSYANTSLANWKYFDAAGRTVNPALYNNVTPPFLIYSSALGFRIFSRLIGLFDIRILFLFAYFLVIILGFVRFKLSKYLLLFLILVCMNPLFNLNLVKGTNDIVTIAILLWSLFFLERKNILFSSILLGVSLATKQTAWFAVPFYFLYVFQKFGSRNFKKFFLISLAVGLIFYLPFLLSDFQHAFSSLIFYPLGNSSLDIVGHPIEGYGFSQLLYTTGSIKSIYTVYPFWIYQLIVGIALTAFLLFMQRKTISPASVLYSCALLTGGVWFFNRYFLETHLAYILVLIGAAAVWFAVEKGNRKNC